MNDTEAWLKRLTLLLERFSCLGLIADIPSLSLNELWALYLYLERLAKG